MTRLPALRRLAALLLAALAAAGCSHTPDLRPTGTAAAIEELHLMAMPLGLNLDPIPGADGFAIKVYAVNPRADKTLPIQSGSLDILMFDGVIARQDIPTANPLKSWSFQSAALADHGGLTTIGMAYSFTLRWESQRPTHPKITVTARYQSPDRPPIYSAPTAIGIVSQ